MDVRKTVLDVSYLIFFGLYAFNLVGRYFERFYRGHLRVASVTKIFTKIKIDCMSYTRYEKVVHDFICY